MYLGRSASYARSLCATITHCERSDVGGSRPSGNKGQGLDTETLGITFSGLTMVATDAVNDERLSPWTVTRSSQAH